MTFLRTLLVVMAALLGAVSVHAQAVPGQGTWETTLQARDVGNTGTTNAFYDTALNITWLRDANVNGPMDWNTAMSWASNLTVGGVGGWRLPVMLVANPSAAYSYDGSTAMGFNIPANSSEIASLFFGALGNKSLVGTDGNILSIGGGLTNTGNFQNLQSDRYWSGTEFAVFPSTSAWQFDNGYGYGGYQSPQVMSGQLYAMAVHPGDLGTVVASVPEPETYAMLLAGLGLIGTVARRRRSDRALVAKL